MAQSLQSVTACTVAARGAEYNNASSPKPLHEVLQVVMLDPFAKQQKTARPQVAVELKSTIEGSIMTLGVMQQKDAGSEGQLQSPFKASPRLMCAP